MNHKHKCPLCDKVYTCTILAKHGEGSGECMDSRESFCDNHSIEEYEEYLRKEGRIF